MLRREFSRHRPGAVQRGYVPVRFGEVAYLIYESTLSPERWPAALDAVAGLFGAKGALVYARDHDAWRVALHSPRIAEAVSAYAEGGWSERNPWLEPPGAFEFRAGDVYRDTDVVDAERMAQDPFYTDFLARFGLHWQMAAVIHSDLGTPTGLVVQRAPEGGAFADADTDTLLHLSRHLEQSLRISAQVAEGKAAHGSMAGAFDALDRPAFVLDHEQRPVVVNRSAAGLVEQCFRKDGGRLEPRAEGDRAAFSAAVQGAHGKEQGAEEGVQSPPAPAIVSDGEGNRMALWTVPLVGDSADSLGITRPHRHVLVLGQRVRQDRRVDPALVRDALGITLGQARLAALIAAGMTAREAAVELGIAEGTARIVLKRIFAALGIHRQAELVAKVAALAA
jgi:DNA-binding CsgD family transcriptional regulator